MTLYHVTWCPECAVVRQRLDELNVPYQSVIVPDARPMREQVFEVSGQYYVPTLKDGDTILTETRDILAYLDSRYAHDGSTERAHGEEEGPPSCRL